MPPLPENKAAPDPGEDLVTRLRKLAEEFAALPDYDTRMPDEIIGYDENGMW
jgi:hypothetical protein